MKRLLVAVGAIVVAAVAVSSAQSPAATPYKVPRLRDGRPDLQGTWTTQTFTPLQRPKRYAGREFLTDAEADELIKLLAKGGVDPLATNIFGATDEERAKRVEQSDETHYNNADWLATAKPKTLSSRRTSLIFDPPDGLIPPQTPEGQKRTAARRAIAGFDSYETRPAQERCIVWTHEGPPMTPPRTTTSCRSCRCRATSWSIENWQRRRGSSPWTAGRIRRARSATGLAIRSADGKATRWSSTRRTSTTRPPCRAAVPTCM
jgi:hypothetical protein